MEVCADNSQPFRKEELTKTSNFFDDAESAPWTVDGCGQRVYWKGCFIIEYEGEEVIARHEVCDGEGKVERGTKLYFGGGKVKEE
ncbi:hypothetical protein N658DRAFT_435173 [Parathielavia hyrcaniae]|uniref:Uncharacterized protein n=1 Tax=Parathielavia hyrcaniae TaxID=113614 RepID=A0AAN6SXQ8_9PEZI|nr:hypothetical protein N658DRAFT_435173 [Parathielavia hyrcaniae]